VGGQHDFEPWLRPRAPLERDEVADGVHAILVHVVFDGGDELLPHLALVTGDAGRIGNLLTKSLTARSICAIMQVLMVPGSSTVERAAVNR